MKLMMLTTMKAAFVLTLVLGAALASAQAAQPKAAKTAKTAMTGPTAASQAVLDKAPAAVKATIEKEGAGFAVTGVAKAMDGANAVYVARVSKGAESYRLTVGEAGNLITKTPTVSMRAVPAMAKAGLKKAAMGGTILAYVEKADVNGRVRYTALVKPIKSWNEITIAADGKVVKTEAVNLQEELSATTTTLEAVPAAAKATIEKGLDGAKLVQVEKGLEDGKVAYVAEMLKGTERSEITVGEDGKLLERVLLIRSREVPAAVTAALKKEAAGMKVLSEIEKSTDANPTYTFSVQVLGDPIKVSVGENGRPARAGGGRGKKAGAAPGAPAAN